MIRAALLWLVLALPVAAQDLPDPMHTSVNDYAGVLNNDDIRAIDQALIALNEQTGVEGTVVTMTDRARYGGTDGLEAFATRLFNHWGVGSAERNDGFMLLLLVDDRETRIELGKGYPRGFDAIAAGIVTTMLPAFREGDYSRGMRLGTSAVISRIAQPHAAGKPPELNPLRNPENWPKLPPRPVKAAAPPPAPPEPVAQPPQTWFAYLFPKVVIGFFLFLGGFIGLGALREKMGNGKCPSCGKRDLVTMETPVRDPQEDGGWRVSQMAVKRICQACGWSEEFRTAQPKIITYAANGAISGMTANALYTPPPWKDLWNSGSGRSDNEHSSSRSDDDRGGGFGGGSSSGGGASGRW